MPTLPRVAVVSLACAVHISHAVLRIQANGTESPLRRTLKANGTESPLRTIWKANGTESKQRRTWEVTPHVDKQPVVANHWIITLASRIEVATGLQHDGAMSAGLWCFLAFMAPLLLIGLSLSMGGPPPVPEQRKLSETKTPPRIITVFTGIVCVGVMANVTVIIPSAQQTAEASGAGLAFSGGIIAVYSIGALCSLPVFASFSVAELKSAFLLHAFCMTVGNLGLGLAGKNNMVWLLMISRIFCGFEGGCMYNTANVMLHFAQGSATTPYLVLYQFFIACGVLLGPTLASVSLGLARVAGMEGDFAVNGFMAIWGVLVFVAISLFFPSDYRQMVDAYAETSSPREPESMSMAEVLSSPKARQGLSLMALLLNCTFLRLLQRLVWESGAVYIMSDEWGWGAETSGYVVGALGIIHALVQLFVSYTVAGVYPDKCLMRVLEWLQMVGILMMFGETSETGHAIFLTGSVIAYCSSSVWGGICTSFCLKRSMEGTFFARRSLLFLNQIAIFAGIACGSVVSRSLLALDPSESMLATNLLVGAVLQWFSTNYVILEKESVELMRAVSTAVSATIAICVLVKSLGGTGGDNVFTWHIVGMAVAWPGFASLGISVYSGTQSMSLMEKNPQRTLHMVCMLLTFAFSIFGYWAIYKAHADNGEGQTGGLAHTDAEGWHLERSTARFVHVAIGYLVLLGSLAQVPLGLWKRWAILEHGERIVKWHGKFGRVLCIGGLTASSIGVWIKFNSDGGWSMGLKVALTVGLAMMLTDTIWPLVAPPRASAVSPPLAAEATGVAGAPAKAAEPATADLGGFRGG